MSIAIGTIPSFRCSSFGRDLLLLRLAVSIPPHHCHEPPRQLALACFQWESSLSVRFPLCHAAFPSPTSIDFDPPPRATKTCPSFFRFCAMPIAATALSTSSATLVWSRGSRHAGGKPHLLGARLSSGGLSSSSGGLSSGSCPVLLSSWLGSSSPGGSRSHAHGSCPRLLMSWLGSSSTTALASSMPMPAQLSSSPSMSSCSSLHSVLRSKMNLFRFCWTHHTRAQDPSLISSVRSKRGQRREGSLLLVVATFWLACSSSQQMTRKIVHRSCCSKRCVVANDPRVFFISSPERPIQVVNLNTLPPQKNACRNGHNCQRNALVEKRCPLL